MNLKMLFDKLDLNSEICQFVEYGNGDKDYNDCIFCFEMKVLMF